MPNYLFYLVNQRSGEHYYALYKLNEGGFGVVFSGSTRAGAGVAIKLIKPAASIDSEWQSWLREVDVAIKCLQHPHVVQIVDFFRTQDGHLAIVMEKALYSLDDLLNSGYRFNARDVGVIGMQILVALSHIHSQCILHRDVTPKNILVFLNGVYKLADFGISKEHVTSQELARTLIGFKTFVPPELLWYGYSTYQSDLYQLGLVMLNMLTGQKPIPEALPFDEISRLISDGIPRQVAESLMARGGTLGKVAEVVAKMLRRRDFYRYQNAREVYDDLAKIVKAHDAVAAFLRHLPGGAPGA